jgi:hypothetical protein
MESIGVSRPEDSRLQALWSVVFALHPHRQVAECVLVDACEVVDCLSSRENRRDAQRESPESEEENRRDAQHERPDSRGFNIVGLTAQTVWQAAAYLASEEWERDQEGTNPTKSPRYQPTAEDRLVRSTSKP